MTLIKYQPDTCPCVVHLDYDKDSDIFTLMKIVQMCDDHKEFSGQNFYTQLLISNESMKDDSSTARQLNYDALAELGITFPDGPLNEGEIIIE